MSLLNMPGAKRVDDLLTDDQKLTLMDEYEKGRIRPAGALAYLKAQGINTGGIDRMDVSDWLRATGEPPADDDNDDDEGLSDEELEALKTLTDEELGALAALSDEERTALLETDEEEDNDDDHDTEGPEDDEG